jgi:hypothetical protein
MKTSTRILTLTAVAILAGYSTWTTVRLWQLEDRLDQLNRLQSERPGPLAPAHVDYVFSDSFIKYSGEQGMVEVERALEVSRRNPVFERTPAREAEEFDLESLWEWRPEARPPGNGI